MAYANQGLSEGLHGLNNIKPRPSQSLRRGLYMYLRGARRSAACPKSGSALARFKTRVTLVDHVDATFAAYNDAVLVAIFRRLE